MIISYVGYSPPKCTCHGKQSHSSKYMILLECLHARSHFSSPHRLPHTCLSQMRVKLQFFKQKFLFSKTQYRVLVNTLDYLRGELLDISPKQSWVLLRDELLDNSPRQFSGKSSLKFLSQSFSIFHFFHAMHSHLPSRVP